MKKILFYFLLCLFCSPIVSAQKNVNWENALVILQNGDSLSGKVLYKNEADIYLGFTFEDATKSTRQFKAKDIQSLILPDYKVQYDQITFTTKQDTFTILATPIVKGTASLYQAQIDPEKFGLNEAQEPFFIIKSPKGVFPILHNPNPNQIEYNKFKGILNYITGECNEQEEIKRLRYTSNDIGRVVLNYNKCKDPDAALVQIHTKTHIPAILSHQVMVGGVITNSTVGSQLDHGQTFDKPYSSGSGFTLGYSLQAIYPSISKRIFTEFGLGLVYINYKANPRNRWWLKENDDFFTGRLKILAGYLLAERSAVMPVIQIGPSFMFTEDISSFKPLLNIGTGVGVNRFFIGGLVEFPFTSFSHDSFYSLNFKYTFARSKNKKQK